MNEDEIIFRSAGEPIDNEPLILPGSKIDVAGFLVDAINETKGLTFNLCDKRLPTKGIDSEG